MRILKTLLLASAAGLLAIGAAQAADLPTKKAPPPAAAKPNCYGSFYDWLNSTPADCPISYMGITVYGTIDMGGGYETHASKFNDNFANGVSELVAKSSNNGKWQPVPNGLSQSNVGIKINEPIGDSGFAVVGDINTGFDPYSLRLANGPRSLVENDGVSSIFQSANGDSSRAGQWDNTRAYAGVSSKTFGTLTAGRQYAFSNDLANNYDPFGGAYAFSAIGSSGTPVGGLGDTEMARYNTSIKYQVAYSFLRAGAMWQFGNYSDGNGSNGAYQFDVGGDYAGFSVDGIYSHVTDALFQSALSSSALATLKGADDLAATIANVQSWAIGGKYKYNQFQVFSGYAYDRFSDPTDSYSKTEAANGFNGVGDFAVPGNNFVPGNVNLTAYLTHKTLQTAWVGGKYSILSNLDFAVGYYHEWQNNYTNSTTKYNVGNGAGGYGTGTATGKSCGPNLNYPYGTATPQGSNSGNCPGHEDIVSGMLDWRPVKRVDIYGGVMYSKVEGGMANGYAHTDNTAYTGGVRVNF